MRPPVSLERSRHQRRRKHEKSANRDAVDALRQAIVGRERVEASGSELYLVYPDGAGRS